jgi:chromosome partitioning protein
VAGPAAAVGPPITPWDIGKDHVAKPPKGTTHVVLDTPAGLHGKELRELMRSANKVLVPLAPSVFDIFATRAFLDELAEHRKASNLQVGIVGMRVDSRTWRPTSCRPSSSSWGCRCWPSCGRRRTTSTWPRAG